MSRRPRPVCRLAVACLLVLGAAALAPAASAEEEEEGVRIGLLTFREGPFPEMGAALAQGFNDYVAVLNRRDGGIADLPVAVAECAFAYQIPEGADCYDRLAGQGVSLVVANSSGVAEAVGPRAAEAGVPVLADGHGTAALADGRVSPWVFSPPMSELGAMDGIIQHIARIEGGFDKLRNRWIGYLYLDNEFGRAPLEFLEQQARTYGFGLKTWAIPAKYAHDQRAQWRQASFSKPDWLILGAWGPMITVALDRADQLDFPVDRVIGGWWTTAEPHIEGAQDSATGYRAATYHTPGEGAEIHARILETVYGGDETEARRAGWGGMLHTRGIVSAMFATEAIRQSIDAAGGFEGAAGSRVRQALASLAISEDRLAATGLAGVIQQLLVDDCRHAGLGSMAIQQWDGARWILASGWNTPRRDMVRPFVEAAAQAHARANDITLDQTRCGG